MLQMSFTSLMWDRFQLLHFKTCWKPFNGVIRYFYSSNKVDTEGVHKIKELSFSVKE